MRSIGKQSAWAKLLYEFFGTAVLVYSYNVITGDAVRARPLAYFMMWVLAFKVSGAHFNPATSLAVFFCERRINNLVGFLLTMLVQLCGAYLGIGMSYLLIKDYLDNFYLLPTASALYFNPVTKDPYWGRLILQETF
jgi:glycerol uptake facilitator-like aquaporin